MSPPPNPLPDCRKQGFLQCICDNIENIYSDCLDTYLDEWVCSSINEGLMDFCTEKDSITSVIYSQLELQPTPALAGATTSTTYSLVFVPADQNTTETIYGIITAGLSYAGYNVDTAVGNAVWNLTAGNTYNLTFGSYTASRIDTNTDELVANKILDWFAELLYSILNDGDSGTFSGDFRLDAVTNIGKDVVSDSILFASFNHVVTAVTAVTAVTQQSNGSLPTTIIAGNFPEFLAKVVTQAVEKAGRNVGGVTVTAYTLKSGAIDKGFLAASSSVTIAYANSVTRTNTGYGQLSGSGTTFTGMTGAMIADYWAVASEVAADFILLTTDKLVGDPGCNIATETCAVPGSQASVSYGNSTTLYKWVLL